MFRITAIAGLSLLVFACTPPPTQPDGPVEVSTSAIGRLVSRDLAVKVADVLDAGDVGSLVADDGWVEYRIELENRSRSPLTVHDVKVLNRGGRYFASAGSYEEVLAPPDATELVAGQVARQSASIAAGQVVPYGATVVGLVSSLLSASASQAQADARRRFERSRIKEIELAPHGRMSGSAFLPRIGDARALVIDYSVGPVKNRMELPLR